MSEAQNPDPDTYTNFNSFFTRALRPEVRPIAQGSGQIACPNDGAISQLGIIEGERIFQAKGRSFSLVELLGGSEERARPYVGGSFATLYLSPGDYHRYHMPLAGRLIETVYIPGRLFSVAHDFTESVPNLFARNERVACLFETEAGPMAIVLVGAMFVGSIETVWAGEITPPRGRGIEVRNYDTGTPVRLGRGDELGRFNMGGSTVIVLFRRNCIKWQTGLVAESRVKLGQLLGVVI
jgi:phosphatidylserine decarboxylase